MYAKRKAEVPSFSHFCSGKTINITHSQSVFVALGIQHAKRVRHTVICGLSGSTIVFYIISQTEKFMKNVFENKMCFDFLCKVCVKYFLL